VPEEEPVPTYQYACTDCGEPLEVAQKFSDDPLTVCPSCGGSLRKVFSAAAIVFKGSGFYRNDSRKPGESAAKNESKPDTKSDAKSDAKKDTKKDSKDTGKSSSSEKVA
jgi:putative FmdB family regulatory protein